MSSEIQPHGGHVPARTAPRFQEGAHSQGYPGGGRAGQLSPEWVWVGVDVPAGKRLYASKELTRSAFEVAVDQHMNGQGWHLETVMANMLVITKPTYPECLAELMKIWANWEASERGLPVVAPDRKMLP